MAAQPPWNTGRMNPIYEAGAVLMNGKLDANDMRSRENRMEVTDNLTGTFGSSAQPYYPMPQGMHGNSHRHIKTAEIVFRNKALTEVHFATNMIENQSYTSNISPDVSSTLNGLGESATSLPRLSNDRLVPDDELTEMIMQRLEVMGISVTSNNKNNESNITYKMGGIGTRTHEGEKPISPGDWIIATAPPMSSIRDRQGGLDSPDDIEGRRVTLRGEPYDSSIHEHTPRAVYVALKMMEADRDTAKRNYLHGYLTLCLMLHKSICMIMASGLVAFQTKGWINGTEKVTVDGLVDALNGKNTNASPSREVRNILRDSVFAAYLPRADRDALGLKFDVDAAAGIGSYMRASADLVRTVLSRVFCRALSSAVNKTDYDYSMFQPAY